MSKKPLESKYTFSPVMRERLRSLLDEFDMSASEFSLRANISKDVVGRMLVYGIVPSLRTLIKAADVFEVPLMYLLGKGGRDLIPSATPSTFHARIAEISAERGEKYSEISHHMSFAPNSIYEWLRAGTLPSIDYLEQLAAYFDVSCDYLLGRTDFRK